MTLWLPCEVQNLGLWLDVNGKRMLIGNTASMIFSVRTLVAYVSRYMQRLRVRPFGPAGAES
jgi:2-keto-4-pentenoate hydratase/2-oxohepta-3-ene-1,7-dioic acid hydratase in catechol pathway